VLDIAGGRGGVAFELFTRGVAATLLEPRCVAGVTLRAKSSVSGVNRRWGDVRARVVV
jgi:hypothetical protein